MMHDAFAKNGRFFEGLVKVIVDIVRNIALFDNWKYYKQFPFWGQKQSKGQSPNEAKV